ncbi:riboflavin synthase, partial [bacterium]|nr:riboflavin synthase [bacterium]
LVPKGSITVHGISLTLVEITETTFSCHLIPHTLTATNLHRLKAGNRVNLEYDIIGKYLYNFQALSTP